MQNPNLLRGRHPSSLISLTRFRPNLICHMCRFSVADHNMRRFSGANNDIQGEIVATSSLSYDFRHPNDYMTCRRWNAMIITSQHRLFDGMSLSDAEAHPQWRPQLVESMRRMAMARKIVKVLGQLDVSLLASWRASRSHDVEHLSF